VRVLALMLDEPEVDADADRVKTEP